MSDRMIVITVPWGSHILLPSDYAIMAVKSLQFVNRENYPAMISMVKDQSISIETVEKGDILPFTPEAPAKAEPSIVEEVQAMNQEVKIETGDIPF